VRRGKPVDEQSVMADFDLWTLIGTTIVVRDVQTRLYWSHFVQNCYSSVPISALDQQLLRTAT
jgi:hypothetical protein